MSALRDQDFSVGKSAGTSTSTITASDSPALDAVIYVCVCSDNSAAVISISDSGSNTYSQVMQSTSGAVTNTIMRSNASPLSVPAGSFTLTATDTNRGTSFLGVMARSYTGIAPGDPTDGTDSRTMFVAASPQTSDVMVPTQPLDVFIAFLGDNDGANAGLGIAAGEKFSMPLANQDGANGMAAIMADYIAIDDAGESCKFTWTSGDNSAEGVIAIIAIKTYDPSVDQTSNVAATAALPSGGLAVTWPTSPSAGTKIVLNIGFSAASDMNAGWTITDGPGNVYHQEAGASTFIGGGTNIGCTSFYADNINTGGSFTITISNTTNGAGVEVSAEAQSYFGVVLGGAEASNAAQVATVSTTATALDLFITNAANNGGGTGNPLPGGTWTVIGRQTNGTDEIQASAQKLNVTGLQSVTWTDSTATGVSAWVTSMLAYKPAANIRLPNRPTRVTRYGHPSWFARQRPFMSPNRYALGGTTAVVNNQDLTPTAVVTTATITKVVNKLVVPTAVVTTGSITKVANKLLTPTAVVTTASLTKVVNKVLASTAEVTTATMTKVVNKLMAVTPIVAAASSVKLVLKNLAAVDTTTAVTGKVVQQLLVPTAVATTASIVTGVARTQDLTALVVTSASIDTQLTHGGTPLKDVFREDYTTNTAFYSPGTYTDVIREIPKASPDDSWITRVRQFFRGRF